MIILEQPQRRSQADNRLTSCAFKQMKKAQHHTWDEKVLLCFSLLTMSLTIFAFLAPLITSGLFLKKLFQKVVQRVINPHYSSDPGNLVAFIKSFQNNWISVLMLCHNINATVLTRTTQEQATAQACITDCSEYSFECFSLNVFSSRRWIASQ